MKIRGKRIALTVILAILFIIAFGWVIMMQNHAALIRNNSGEDTLKREEVTQTLDDIRSAWNIMERHIQKQYKVDATLSALALRNIITKSEDKAIAMYKSGAVIKVTDDEITAPEGIEQKLGLTPDLFSAREGLFESPQNTSTLVVYSRISGPYFYVEWHEDTIIQKETEEALDIPGILRKAEAAYDVYALCAVEDADSETGERVLYCNDIIKDLEEEFSKQEVQDFSEDDDAGTMSFQSGTMSLQDVTFHYVKTAVPEVDGYLILLSIQPNLYVKALSQGTYMFTALILLVAALITSCIWLYVYIRNNVLNLSQEKRYQPSNVRRFAALCGIIGAILIFLSGLMIYALNGLYDDTARGKERLKALEESLSMYNDRVKQNMDRFIDIYRDYGAHIAEVLDNYPELREQSVLETLSDSISASSITLYDAYGDETVSSGEFIGLTLGSDSGSVTNDFRRILNGVPSIVHGMETDEITGESGIRVAVRIKDDSDESRFGVMVICVDPEQQGVDITRIADSVLRNLAGEGASLCIALRESGTIVSASRDELLNRDVLSLGLETRQLQDSGITTVNTEEGAMFVITEAIHTSDEFDETQVFGTQVSGTQVSGTQASGTQTSGTQASEAQTSEAQISEERIACYVLPKSMDVSSMLASALTGGLLFIVIYAVLAWLLLGKYTREEYEKYKKTSQTNETRRKDWHGVRQYITSIRPERVGFITMEVIVGLYLIQQIPIAGFDTALSRNSVYYYINSGKWEKGLNLFAIAGILILLGQILMVVILLRILLALVSTFLGTKGRTICRLIRSLVMYLALFTFLILGLNYLGVGMSTILAAIATLGISVSLGAQHFVSDIIAGLTMVFEGTVHAGDIVDLGIGMRVYHGEVQEIGLRFIRLMTPDGNIIALSNRDITVTTNLTQLNSRCSCELRISSEYPIEEIEEMLKKKLPEIGKNDRRILKGPDYNGIIALEGGTMTLLITAECAAKDLTDVQLMLNRSVQQIFRQNGYRI